MRHRYMKPSGIFIFAITLAVTFVSILTPPLLSQEASQSAKLQQFVNQYCVDCHSEAHQTLSLHEPQWLNVATNSDDLEKVVTKLRSRQMPPKGSERPNDTEYSQALNWLSQTLDQHATLHPQPGRTESLRRLNRTEFQNSIRDLLAIDADVNNLLPADESSRGFDNITVSNLSPTLLNRYITAAERISRLAIGVRSQPKPLSETFRVPADLTQEAQIAGLPYGTRGGTLIAFNFPYPGEYEIQVWLARDRNEEIEGLRGKHQLQVLIDRGLKSEFTIQPPRDKDFSQVDSNLKARVNVTAGPHDVGVTFVKQPSSLLETRREPYAAHFNMHRHPRLTPAVFQVSITGPLYTEPLQKDAPVDATPSRQRIFTSYPQSIDQEEECAREILSKLTRQAYRRPITASDLRQPMQFFKAARDEFTAQQNQLSPDKKLGESYNADAFETGIQSALSCILVNPHFLFRIEQDPVGIAPQTAYRISDIELATRLSYFLWSSLPDEEMLKLAERQELHQPEVLEAQTRRLLQDPRSRNLATNFAAQWLYLRNLDSITPDLRQFPDFDDNLRQAFRTETEMHFEYMLREDKSVLELLSANYTFLNERLAKHYEIPHIYGSHFRKVELPNLDSQLAASRGGILRHGSILTVTSYATRTSPVIRGDWILKNVLGSPTPPPPANVPALEDNTIAAGLPIRERLDQHRNNAACAVCHDVMDPIGFALENYDAVGRWRTTDAGQPVDASGELLDGSQIAGVAELEKAILAQPETFVGTLAEKLLTFALGRPLTTTDAPTIRAVVRDADSTGYRFSSIVVAITRSPAFQMRMSAE